MRSTGSSGTKNMRKLAGVGAKLGIIQGMEERLREKFGAGGGERHAGRLIVPAAFIPGL